MYCRRCGTPLHLGVVICPECGARQRRQASSIRCASCHHRVPVSLAVCPHCGRDVRPAGVRWGLWLAVGIALALIVLWGLGKLPVEQMGQDIVGIKAKIASLVQVLGPAPATGQAERTPQLIARSTPMAAPTTAAVETQPDVDVEAEQTVSEAILEEAAAEPSATAPPLTEPLEAPLPGAQTITQTVTAVPTQTPSATPTSAPTPTATEAPPTATRPAPAATATAAPTTGGTANTYRVRAGDTLFGIAQQFNVSLDALLAANRISATTMLRIGQELVIPGAGVPPTPTFTPRPRATSTPTSVPPTPAPYLPAPVLTGPGDQASYRESDQIELAWEPVPGLAAGSQYEVRIRYVHEGVPLDYYWFTTGTKQRVPPWLWGLADQPERKYQWFIRAVRLTTDGQGGELTIPLSPNSETRTFYWN